MLNFAVAANGNPQNARTQWTATETQSGTSFLVGYTIGYNDGDGPHRGISQDRVLSKIPALYYDRFAFEQRAKIWAHFIWPSVIAEGNGHHLRLNTYDRARFTFGFYQLAAHTPNDNLILLFRRLLALPSARDYFPDLLMQEGRVHRRLGDGTLVSLEVVTSVTRPNGKVEDQIVGFMSYLNPDTLNTGEAEVINGARLMHWLLNDLAALDATLDVSLEIMRRKLRGFISTFGLNGKRPELGIWVSDIKHHSRGKDPVIRAALAQPSFEAQMAALYAIGSGDSNYDTRRNTVRSHINQLIAEGRFNGMTLGQGVLIP